MAISDKDSKKQILDFIQAQPLCSSREIHNGLKSKISYATVKRAIGVLLIENLISSIGKGKATRYELSKSYNLIYPVDISTYFLKEIDERVINVRYNHNLIKETMADLSLFSDDELSNLFKMQNKFKKKIFKLSEWEFKKEFERLAIDLSWKSSQIEGNTYSLLETERLLIEKESASGKTKDEAIMLLNHKKALDFLFVNPSYIHPLTTARIEDIHSILIKDLHVARNIRSRKVGISGTNYLPLDNEFQIKEALNDMCSVVNKRKNVFEKAFLVLVLISYIQPFTDGNKRTARIISNAILMHHHYCPISYRTVSSIDYKKALLVFYEQNNISAFKKIFIEQFEFAVNTYF